MPSHCRPTKYDSAVRRRRRPSLWPVIAKSFPARLGPRPRPKPSRRRRDASPSRWTRTTPRRLQRHHRRRWWRRRLRNPRRYWPPRRHCSRPPARRGTPPTAWSTSPTWCDRSPSTSSRSCWLALEASSTAAFGSTRSNRPA